ncbi:MAG: class I SAM-dependent methyltransferase [Bacteroidetes bacterium]|nr:class I SAM-dependent methyltransferase [Bacteroidota bacterium]
MSKAKKIFTEGWEDYSLIDAGGGKKLERWGKVITIRPERQAYFHSGLPFAEWKVLAHLEFEEISTTKGKWKVLKPTTVPWSINYQDLCFLLNTTPFKHIGLFPEQSTNWAFIRENLKENQKILNLFAYTGASSLAGKSIGAEVVHVDSLKQLIDWSSQNMKSSKLDGIKWVCEDALKFANRELKRGHKYDLIQMDPPAFGRGAKGEKWFLEQKIEELIETAFQLLNKDGWLILNTYSPKVNFASTYQKVKNAFRSECETAGELWMKTGTDKELYYGDIFRIQKK